MAVLREMADPSLPVYGPPASTTGGRLDAITVVGSLSLLLALAAGSPPPLTLAVLVTPGTAAAATETVSVMAGALPPAAIVFAASRMQVTVWASAVQGLQPVPVPETKPRPVGRTSVTVTLALVAVPPPFDTARL